MLLVRWPQNQKKALRKVRWQDYLALGTGLELDKSLYQTLQIFIITSLEKVPILQVFEAFDSNLELLHNSPANSVRLITGQ